MNRRWQRGSVAVLAVVGMTVLMTSPASAALMDTAADDAGFSFQTLIFIILGVIALIVVSSLGPLSRMAERREELRLEAKNLEAKNLEAKNLETKNLEAEQHHDARQEHPKPE